MSFRVLIVDNKTGRTVADYEEAGGVLGAILHDDAVHGINGVHANPLRAAALIETAQKVLAKAQEENPELVLLAQVLGEMTQKMEERE